MCDLEKPAALFVPTEDFDPRFYDTAPLGFPDPILDQIVEPLVKRPRTSERSEFVFFLLILVFSNDICPEARRKRVHPPSSGSTVFVRTCKSFVREVSDGRDENISSLQTVPEGSDGQG